MRNGPVSSGFKSTPPQTLVPAALTYLVLENVIQVTRENDEQKSHRQIPKAKCAMPWTVTSSGICQKTSGTSDSRKFVCGSCGWNGSEQEQGKWNFCGRLCRRGLEGKTGWVLMLQNNGSC